MSLIDGPHFKVAEFRSHDGVEFPPWLEERWNALRDLCEAVRDLWGGPLQVVSGYRTEAWNQHLIDTGHHPEAHSYHTIGMAADLRPELVTGRDTVLELHERVLMEHEAGRLPALGGLGLYGPEAWIHCDTFHAPDGHLRKWSLR